MDRLNLEKQAAENELDLRKKAVQKLCLEKKISQNETARVALVLDASGSMYDSYSNGTMQSIINRLLPIAMNFDDNGEMELWTFNHGFKRQTTINKKNFFRYVKSNLDAPCGGTCYGPVMNDVGMKYIQEEPANLPNFVIFITDGENNDVRDTNKVIQNLSRYPIFFQFIGVGDTNFSYLRDLDENVPDRYVDNANFFAIPSIDALNKMNDEELYSKLLKEYPTWLEYKEVKEMIKKQTSRKTKYKNYYKHNKSGSGSGSSILGDVLEIVSDIF